MLHYRHYITGSRSNFYDFDRLGGFGWIGRTYKHWSYIEVLDRSSRCSVCVGGWRRLSFLTLCLFVCWSVCLFVWFSIPILIPYNSLNNYQSNSLYKSQVYKKQECARGGRGNVNSKLVKFRQDLKKIKFDFISQKIIEKIWIFFRKYKKITEI